jgi:hypothetical protein
MFTDVDGKMKRKKEHEAKSEKKTQLETHCLLARNWSK